MSFPEPPTVFQVPFGAHSLCADTFQGHHSPHLGCIHGGGPSGRAVFGPLRQMLQAQGIGSTAVDCIGHGHTAGDWADSSLHSRNQQFIQAMRHTGRAPGALIGISMGAYNAICLSERWALEALVLVVPAVYHPAARIAPFGPAFSQIIRQPQSWLESDAWERLRQFRGRLLVIAAECDQVIPSEIPQRLYAAAKQASHRRLLTLAQSGHQGSLPRILERPQWRAALLDCIRGPRPERLSLGGSPREAQEAFGGRRPGARGPQP